MNLAKVYSEATGKAQLAAKRLEEEQNKNPQHRDAPSITESEMSAQSKIDWLSHPKTEAMFKDIGVEISRLRSYAVSVACSQNPSHPILIQTLAKVQALETVVESFTK